ncbi:MAG: DNA topoisomerase I [Candidatus Aenigmarchaeota archaeon ex4484_224]|nr:MAG: DNA topoisomerase I [Candidatus Aenigmarchaeota archaeon ex4484_224]
MSNSGKYILIIAEKPTAMKKIASSLAEKGSLKQKEIGDVKYFEFKRNGKKHIVVSAVGHLFNLDVKDKSKGWIYPVFEAIWRPSFLVKKSSLFSKKYFEVIKKLAKDAKEVIIATDYDVEGSVIGYNILRFLLNRKEAKRMKFSTLTKDELIQAYENLTSLNKGQIEAGLTRHYLDWLWGINLTRALTLSLKNNGKKVFSMISTGRVQGPALSLLFEREQQIKKFIPKPYWEIYAKIKIGNKVYLANFEIPKIWKEDEMKKIQKELKKVKKGIVVEIRKKKYKQKPPVPFNTTDLQTEAYSQFKFSPSQTMSIAENLYQRGYISYPRSSSQKLPPSINYKKIISSLAKIKSYSSFAKQLLAKKELKPNEGKKDDPAHPAVYATQEIPDLSKLSKRERKLYDLIARRTLAVFGDFAIRESIHVLIEVNGKKFVLVGKKTLEEGWTKIYKPYMKLDEIELPELKKGQEVKIEKIEIVRKETQPPARYSQGSIIKELEKRNLGTKATRAEILRTLYDRGYISGKSIVVSKIGEAVVKILKKFSPLVLSEKLTRKFEEEMELVFNGKKSKEEVIEEAKKVLKEILEEFKKNEIKIGKELSESIIKVRESSKILGKCPKCGGDLIILRSKKTKKFFVGCSNYPKCNAAYPLPQNARIEPTGKVCEFCGTPIIRVYRKGKRPFQMCLDPNCPSKKDWN